MADARFPGRWINDRRVMALTGDVFKAFIVALAWSVENRTDGLIRTDDIEFIPRFTPAHAAALVTAGLWETTTNGWQIVDYKATQTTRSEFETLENNRRREREKKARQRARVPGDVPGDMSRGTAQARTGQAGQASESAGILDWPVAQVPADPGYCEHGMTLGMKCRQCPSTIATAA